ncbi:uncharacterized protein LOC128263326 [Drosophila gunungcola]|uniref:Uncharacterized protein n=1 Tax=Drosophila gunungcola TaxID=103775 RepID=A0A9P9YTY5_9MUSC|nr:uncharacterized protein LOC128263326 [Drosophila gunungcola]XP_052854306.1 uncharacterized protein LOC128263326 [Drosophila gunungcola]KAI8042870.1 hypothetical protein M5D96_004193 [Drosophila gunungcola]
MVSQTTIAVTGLLQVLGISFFVAQPKDQSSPAPFIGGHIFLLAILLLFWDSDMIPKRFRQFSPRIFACADLLCTIFVTELLMQVGWCGFERITHQTVRLVCHRRLWCEYGLTTFCTVFGAIASLCIVLEVVCPIQLKDSLAEVLGSLPIPMPASAGPVFHYLQDVRTYVMGAIYFCQLTREQRLLSVRAFEMQLLRSQMTRKEEEHAVPNPESQVDEEMPDTQDQPTEPELLSS